MKNRFQIVSATVLLSTLFLVEKAHGQATPMAPAPSYSNSFSSFSVRSPLATNITDVPSLVLVILNVLITISVPIIVIAIVYAGFTYVTSQGKPEQIKTATRTLTYAVIGAVLIIGALVITDIIGDTITSFGAT